jgi:hypothetical protein
MSALAVRTVQTVLHHLTAVYAERATDGDTVTAPVNLKNCEQCLENTTETLSGDKAS